MDTRPALPLGELGNCLRPPSGSEAPKILEKKGQQGQKKIKKKQSVIKKENFLIENGWQNYKGNKSGEEG